MPKDILVQQGVVRILDAGGKFTGSGFLIDGLLVVTCAHVILSAGSGQDQPVFVKFYNKEQQVGIVTREGWSDPSCYDVAFIRLQKTPVDITPLKLQSPDWDMDKEYYSFYYRTSAGSPANANGKILGSLPDQDEKRPDAFLEIGKDMDYGSSGAPIMARSGVIGMVQGSLSNDHIKVINAQVIQTCLSQLEPIPTSEPPAAPPDVPCPALACVAASVLAMIVGFFLFQWAAYLIVTLFRGLPEAARLDLYTYLFASLCLVWGALTGFLVWNSRVRSKILRWIHKAAK